jgi:hypothetical protein
VGLAIAGRSAAGLDALRPARALAAAAGAGAGAASAATAGDVASAAGAEAADTPVASPPLHAVAATLIVRIANIDLVTPVLLLRRTAHGTVAWMTVLVPRRPFLKLSSQALP